MTTTTIGGHVLSVDHEGFLTDRAQWDEEVAVALAQQVGVELDAERWALLRFLRADHEVSGETATLRRVSVSTQTPIKRLFELFPVKPAKKMAYVAGLPKPRGCV